MNLLGELQAPQPKVVAFFCDSTAAIHVANNPVFHELDCLQVRDRIVSGLINTLHVGISTQLADVLALPLFPSQFNSLISKMSLHSSYSPS